MKKVNKLSVAVFAYNFPHKKTQDFIFRILSEGIKIEVIYAADSIKLKIPKSTIRTKINHIGLLHPKQIAKNLGIKYVITKHDNYSKIKENIGNSKLAIISGARIIKKNIINLFKAGIINFHPGIIPHARGLDSILWSIINSKPCGVTSHLIDSKIDAGKIIKIRKIKLFNDDSILDISERVYELQLDMIKESIQLALNKNYYELEDYGNYNKKMSKLLEHEVIKKLNIYLKNNI